MKLLTATDLCKSFGGQVVLERVSVELRQGEVVLLRGDNGSGKTTLINILTGNLDCDSGELNLQIQATPKTFKFPVTRWRHLTLHNDFTPERLAWHGVGRTWQEVRLFSSQTLRDNISVAAPNQTGENPAKALFCCVSALREERANCSRSAEILDSLGLSEKIKFRPNCISSGQSKKVAIARATSAGARILFLDEPLSGLDGNGKSEVLRLLDHLSRQMRVTLVIVEHALNLPLVLGFASTVWTLRSGKLVSESKEAVQARMDADDFCGTEKFIIQAAQSEFSMIEEKLNGGASLVRLRHPGASNGEVILELDDMVVSRGNRIIIGEEAAKGSGHGLSFAIRRGEIVFLRAPNGWGKTTLLEAIAGTLPVSAGAIRLNRRSVTHTKPWERSGAGMVLLRSRDNLFLNLTVRECLNLNRIKTPPDALRPFLKQRVSQLSGGERQKVAVGCVIARSEVSLGLLDEPFSSLDQRGVEGLLHDLMTRFENAALLIALPSVRNNESVQRSGRLFL